MEFPLSKSVLRLVEQSTALLTRDQGAKARARLLNEVKEGKVVEILFDGVTSYTPSFIDEFLGKTLAALGKKKFKQVVKLTASSRDVKHLVNLVLSNRAGSISA